MEADEPHLVVEDEGAERAVGIRPTVRNVSGKLSTKRLRLPPGSALGEANTGSVSLVSHVRSAGRLAAHRIRSTAERAPVHLILLFMFDFLVMPPALGASSLRVLSMCPGKAPPLTDNR